MKMQYDFYDFYEARQLKSGKWRIYGVYAQALISWRGGDNWKTETIRDDNNDILNFSSLESCEQYTKEHSITLAEKVHQKTGKQ